MLPLRHQALSRARFLACSIILVLTSYGCAASRVDAGTPENTGRFAGLSYVETLTGGANANSELPLLIALHFMGGSPSTSIEDYGGVNVPIRLLSLEGPYTFGDGFSWFPDGYYELDAAAQLEITINVSDRIASFIRAATAAYPTRGKPMLVGFSQGADLTHMIALREPGLILAGLPMGGRFPETWRDAAIAGTDLPSNITLFHGADDDTVNASESLAAAAFYTANGVNVVLHTYAGVGHSYPARMKSDFNSAIARLVESAGD